jgi:hypothetical protein
MPATTTTRKGVRLTTETTTITSELPDYAPRAAVGARPVDGLAVRPIDSPTAFRDVALFWNEKDDGSPSLTAFIGAVIGAPPPPAVERLGG